MLHRFLKLPQLAAALFALTRGFAAESQISSVEWSSVAVPGSTNFAGNAWYRAWVKVPDSYFAAHERNLFEESVGLYIRGLAGAHTVWLNGVQLGSGGDLPPNYRSGQDAFVRHKVPVGTLRRGAWNEIAFRLYHSGEGGPAGFLEQAPFLMDYFLEGVLEGTWEFRLGEHYNPGGALTNRPPRATFDQFQESSRVLGRTAQVHGPSLPPAVSASKLRPNTNFLAELLLSEPLVAQPTHFSFDERGRLWVAQYRQYPYPAGLKMLSRDKYYRAHYDKTPLPPPNHDRGADIISIHEDTDGDGLFDRHKTFVDGLNMANAVVRGRGGVWVMHTPYLLFYPDRDGDDIPDGPPEVRLAGFGLEDTHSVANGLVWGPDGWLYGGQGSTTSCRVTRPGLDAPNAPGVYFEGCMVWRYHPDSRAFEIFAEGSGNTFGLEVDAHGRLYSGHNGGGTRGWHYVQGGFYQMQGVDPGKFGPPRNPYAFGELPMMRTTNAAVRFTHFGAFAEGTAIPSQFAGRLFSLDPLHNVVLTSERQVRGATFETIDGEPALRSDDETFRPLYIANAPDGSLFVSDMCEFYIAHGQHYQNQIDPTTGRIYRLRGLTSNLERDIDLSRKTTEELIALLAHPNKWHRHTAVRLLGERHDPQARAALSRQILQGSEIAALNTLWALHQSVGIDEVTALAALQHSFAPVRQWTARLLGDEWGLHRNLGTGQHSRQSEPGLLPENLFKALVAQAQAETNPEVLSQFASTARRFDASQALPLVAAVLAHDELKQDSYVPLLCWWVFEAHIPQANSEILGAFESPSSWDEPLVFDYILPRLARRYAVDGKRADLLRCARLFELAPTSRHTDKLMEGFEEAFRGRPLVGLPDELVTALTKHDRVPLALRVRQRQAGAVAEALQVIENTQAKLDDRAILIRTLAELREPRAVAPLLALATNVSPATVRKAAFASLASYEDETISEPMVSLLPQLSGEMRIAAFALLLSRTAWSSQLVRAIEAGSLSPALIPPDVISRLRTSKDRSISESAQQLWPASPLKTGEFQTRINEITGILEQAPGNPYAGEATFLSRCKACHKLFFKGGQAGPDLTSYQRDNLRTMLLSIVNPNSEIREGFQQVVLETRDGRTLNGFVVERDHQIILLRGLDGETVVVPTTEVTNLEPIGQSLMPEGLLDGLTDQELRDFFAYLRISQPISN